VNEQLDLFREDVPDVAPSSSVWLSLSSGEREQASLALAHILWKAAAGASMPVKGVDHVTSEDL
jgi:hypothetical protein